MTQNLSIQVLPINTTEAYTQIDKAIETIASSGLHFVTTAFNTQVEGKLDELLELIKQIQKAIFNAGTEEVVLNFQIHAKASKDVFLMEKLNGN